MPLFSSLVRWLAINCQGDRRFTSKPQSEWRRTWKPREQDDCLSVFGEIMSIQTS